MQMVFRWKLRMQLLMRSKLQSYINKQKAWFYYFPIKYFVILGLFLALHPQ